MPESIKNSSAHPYNISEDVIGVMGSYGGVIGGANRAIEEFGLKIPPTDYHGESRWEKFSKTFMGCMETGAMGGAVLGMGAMLIPDCVTGKGTQDPTKYDPESEGVAGLIAHGAVDVSATVAAVPGIIVGGTLGAIAEPMTSAPLGDTISDGAAGGADVASGFTATAGSVTVGFGLAMARVPSLIVKGATTFVGGIVGGTIGLISGGFRALFNV